MKLFENQTLVKFQNIYIQKLPLEFSLFFWHKKILRKVTTFPQVHVWKQSTNMHKWWHLYLLIQTTLTKLDQFSRHSKLSILFLHDICSITNVQWNTAQNEFLGNYFEKMTFHETPVLIWRFDCYNSFFDLANLFCVVFGLSVCDPLNTVEKKINVGFVNMKIINFWVWTWIGNSIYFPKDFFKSDIKSVTYFKVIFSPHNNFDDDNQTSR